VPDTCIEPRARQSSAYVSPLYRTHEYCRYCHVTPLKLCIVVLYTSDAHSDYAISVCVLRLSSARSTFRARNGLTPLRNLILEYLVDLVNVPLSSTRRPVPAHGLFGYALRHGHL